jgi:hypothetical protein
LRARQWLKDSQSNFGAEDPPSTASDVEKSVWYKSKIKALKNAKKFILREVDADRQSLSVSWLYSYLWSCKFVVDHSDGNDVLSKE